MKKKSAAIPVILKKVHFLEELILEDVGLIVPEHHDLAAFFLDLFDQQLHHAFFE